MCLDSQIPWKYLVNKLLKTELLDGLSLYESNKTIVTHLLTILQSSIWPFIANFWASIYNYNCRWCNIKALPGANRLIKHFSSHGVPMALASNSSRVDIESKISSHQGILFQALITSATWLGNLLVTCIEGIIHCVCHFWECFIFQFIFYFPIYRVEGILLCHHWWWWSDIWETISWNVRCKSLVFDLRLLFLVFFVWV